MNRKLRILLLLAFSATLILSGCRRKPIEPVTESETETQSKTQTESETKKVPETTKQTEKETTKQTEKKKVSPKASTGSSNVGNTATQNQAQTAPQTEAPASSQCPYCGYWFYTTLQADGTSDYSNHVSQEEASINDNSYYDASDYYVGSDGVQYAQCPYCFQSFSTAADASGYSPYSEHVAQESAYAATLDDGNYTQCPYCGLWLLPDDYADHTANGW